MTLLAVQDLAVHFPLRGGAETVKAVDGVSFNLRGGETRRFTASARRIPMGSTPRCSKKRRSSLATKACQTWGGSSAIGTHTRRSR